MNKKTVLIIIVSLIACFMIGFLIFFANSFFGNPISKALATHSIKEYVKEEYPHHNLEVNSAVYNFKMGDYIATAKSKDSVDTYFMVHCSWDGTVLDDEYKEMVLSGWNTFHRFEQEYQKSVEDLVASNLPYDFDMIIPGLNKSDQPSVKVPLDAEFDIYNVPYKKYLTVYMYTDELSWDKLAQTTLEVDRLMQENQLSVNEYTIVLEPLSAKEEKKREMMGIYDFPQELLSSENLADVMEKRQAQWENEHEKN